MYATLLCGRDCGELPVRLESKRAHVVLAIFFMFKHCSPGVRRWGARRCTRSASMAGSVSVKRADLDERGVERDTARVVGVKQVCLCSTADGSWT